MAHNIMNQQTYLSEEGYAKLKGELEELQTARRREISERIEEAKKLGDLSENSEYMEAKEAQEFNERKISELKAIVQNTVLISKDRQKDVVQIGSTIKVKDKNGSEREFMIVGSAEADPASGKISHISPIGNAFLNKRSGDAIMVKTPAGSAHYKILDIK